MSTTLAHTRPYRLSAMAAAVQRRAVEIARTGDSLRAQRAAAIAEALHHAAGGDLQGRKLALLDAKWLRRAAL